MAEANSPFQCRESARGLPWLARRLNEKLSVSGKQMVVPADLNHPLGNHALINHDWSQKDKDTFRSNGQLSLSASLGSDWANDVAPNAVALRFIEGHARPLDSSTDEYTHEISGSYLMPLCEGQKQVLWIISTMPPEKHRKLPKPSEADSYYTHESGLITSPTTDCYYIIPSGFTKASTLERQSKSTDPVSNYMTPSAHAIPGVARQPLCQGSALFVDDTFDPQKYVVHVDKLPEIFEELFDTSASSEMSIPSTSGPSSANETFRKEDYLTLHRDVHQASWDFGLSFREY